MYGYYDDDDRYRRNRGGGARGRRYRERPAYREPEMDYGLEEWEDDDSGYGWREMTPDRESGRAWGRPGGRRGRAVDTGRMGRDFGEGWSAERGYSLHRGGYGGDPYGETPGYDRYDDDRLGYDRYGGDRYGRDFGSRDYGGSDWGRGPERGLHYDTGSSRSEGDYGRVYRGDWRSHGPYTGRGPEGYRRSKEAIRDEANERLTRHGQLDASRIQVEVNDNGEITLNGTVDSRRAKRMAEDAVDDISGVIDVHNHLRIEARGAESGAGAERGGATGDQNASSRRGRSSGTE